MVLLRKTVVKGTATAPTDLHIGIIMDMGITDPDTVVTIGMAIKPPDTAVITIKEGIVTRTITDVPGKKTLSSGPLLFFMREVVL
jgi:hypothetical protein